MSAPSTTAAPLPRPSWADLSTRAELSPARRRVLVAVEESARTVTAAQLARSLQLHHNTVREHLDALAEAGLVAVSTTPSGRRGRPALHYTSAGPDPTQVVGSYLSLLDAIIEQLGDGEQARRQAVAIGRRWAELTPDNPASSTSQTSTSAAAPVTATAQLAAMLPHLSQMGFAPDFDGEQIILKACPLMTASRPPHRLVCLMHEGFLNARYARPQADNLAPTDQVDDGSAAKTPAFSVIPLCTDGCHVTAQAADQSTAPRAAEPAAHPSRTAAANPSISR